MLKRLGATGAALVLVALAGGAVAPATSSGSGPGDAEGRHKVRVLSTNTEEAFVDVGRHGFSLGDAFVFTSKLTMSGKTVGHAGVVCTITSVARGESQCVGTAKLRQGQIAIQGLQHGEPKAFSFPVTGGTGAYEGVEGTLWVREISNTREVLTFYLSH